MAQRLEDYLTEAPINIELSDRAKELKRKIKENTYYLMKFESPNITFPDVSTIIDLGTNLTPLGFEFEVTKNLVKAWHYMIHSPRKFDVDELIKINEIVAKDQALAVGSLRTGDVFVSGTDYKPPLPTKEEIAKLIRYFRSRKNKKHAASVVLIRLIKSQPFWDGNKRTAFISVNKLLLENDMPQLIVSDKNLYEFNQACWVTYYDTDERWWNSRVSDGLFWLIMKVYLYINNPI